MQRFPLYKTFMYLEKVVTQVCAILMVFLCNINPIQLIAIEHILVLSFCCAKQAVLKYLLGKIDYLKKTIT